LIRVWPRHILFVFFEDLAGYVLNYLGQNRRNDQLSNPQSEPIQPQARKKEA